MPLASPVDNARGVRRTATQVLVAAFLVMATVTAAQTMLLRRAEGASDGVWAVVLYSAGAWLSWLVLVPAIVWLGRRFDFRLGRRGRSVVVHLGAALLAHAATMLVTVVLGVRIFSPEEPLTGELLRSAVLLSSRLPFSLLTYAGILGLDRGLGLLQALADREAAAARLEAQATRARLEALAARLHPHFLFNALQSASALVDHDPARARTMLALIGDLLRDVLSGASDADIPLEAELRYLRRYLAIEELRFADRLRIELQVDPGAAAVPVPPFLLQPIAENALRHGLAPVPEGGVLRISAERLDHALRITVWNDGAPLPDPLREGVGLVTTRERLAARYGDAARLELAADRHGVAATLTVPA